MAFLTNQVRCNKENKTNIMIHILLFVDFDIATHIILQYWMVWYKNQATYV